MKVNKLKPGMEGLEMELVIDYIPPNSGRDWGIVYVKDDTKDIRMFFGRKDLKKSEEGKTIKVHEATVSTYRGELQLNTDKPIEFID